MGCTYVYKLFISCLYMGLIRRVGKMALLPIDYLHQNQSFSLPLRKFYTNVYDNETHSQYNYVA